MTRKSYKWIKFLPWSFAQLKAMKISKKTLAAHCLYQLKLLKVRSAYRQVVVQQHVTIYRKRKFFEIVPALLRSQSQNSLSFESLRSSAHNSRSTARRSMRVLNGESCYARRQRLTMRSLLPPSLITTIRHTYRLSWIVTNCKWSWWSMPQKPNKITNLK